MLLDDLTAYVYGGFPITRINMKYYALAKEALRNFNLSFVPYARHKVGMAYSRELAFGAEG